MTEKNYHHGDLKSELIEEGLKIFVKEGYEGFSLRKAAKACGVSQTAPYRHFKDKDELIAAITAHALGEFNASLANAAAKVTDPKKMLSEIGVAYVHFFAENPEYLKLLFLSNIQKYGGKACEEENHYKDGHPFATFFNAVKQYKEANINEGRSAEELIVSSWGLVHGIAVLIAFGQIGGGDCLDIADKVIRNIRI